MNDPETEICRVLALALAIDIPPGRPVSRAAEPKWNSLKHVEIIFALEDAFGIQFSEAEMPTLDSIKALTDAVERHRYAA